MIEKELITCSYVLHGGAISRYGTIKILHSSVPAPSVHDSHAGLELYGPILQKHSKGKHRARIVGDRVEVISRARGTRVARLTYRDLMWVNTALDNNQVRVMPNGYLFHLERGQYREAFPTDWTRSMIEALDDALARVKPAMLDNSPFTRVSPSLAGKILVCLELSGRVYRVFTQDGKPVRSITHRPLAYKRWGQKAPCSGRLSAYE